MIASLPTQEQVDRVARDLAPDVVRIRFSVRDDWSGTPSFYFRVTLSDEASERLSEATSRVREKVSEDLRLNEFEHFPYFRFRSQSSQARLREAAWD
jgi:hypothetical protein